MKKLFTLLTLFLSLVLFSQSDTTIVCDGDYQEVYSYGDTVIVSCNKMVLMNPETFASYYYDSKDLDELQEKVPEWSATIDSLSKAHDKIIVDMDSISKVRFDQVILERNSKETAISLLIEQENLNKTLIKKNKRLRIFSGGSSGLCLLFLLILL